MHSKRLSLLVLGAALSLACQTDRNRSETLKTSEQQRWNQVYGQVDADGDGRITPEEFAANYAAITFRYFDKNWDGVITAEEWSVDGLSPQRIAWFKALDRDGDGAVSEEEFALAGTPEGVEEFFSLMDRDGSGAVTRSDFGIE